MFDCTVVRILHTASSTGRGECCQHRSAGCLRRRARAPARGAAGARARSDAPPVQATGAYMISTTKGAS
jgi:hypothetical protein